MQKCVLTDSSEGFGVEATVRSILFHAWDVANLPFRDKIMSSKAEQRLHQHQRLTQRRFMSCFSSTTTDTPRRGGSARTVCPLFEELHGRRSDRREWSPLCGRFDCKMTMSLFVPAFRRRVCQSVQSQPEKPCDRDRDEIPYSSSRFGQLPGSDLSWLTHFCPYITKTRERMCSLKNCLHFSARKDSLQARGVQNSKRFLCEKCCSVSITAFIKCSADALLWGF